MPAVASSGGRRAFLAAILPYLRTLNVRLYNVPHEPQPYDTALDFPQPTFSGYAQKPVPLLPPPIVTPQFYAESDAPVLTWTVGPGGGSDTIYGWWLADSSGRYIMAQIFDDGPVPMTFPGAVCPVTLQFLCGPLA